MNKITLNECLKQRLEDTYLVVYAIKNEVNIKKDEYIEKCDIYTFIGVDKKGYRNLLNIYQDNTNNSRYWLDCFESLKRRGLKNILFLSVGDNKDIKRTVKISYPNTTIIDSLTDIVPKFYKYSIDRSCKRVAGKIHSLYIQPTINEFNNIFNIFKEEYNNSIHNRLIEKYLSNIEDLYKYSVNVRLLLFKHSANVFLYDKIRLSYSNNRNYITKIDEIYDLFEDTGKYFGFTSFYKREWALILNDIIEMYPEMELI